MIEIVIERGLNAIERSMSTDRVAATYMRSVQSEKKKSGEQ